MRVKVNGSTVDIHEGLSVAELVRSRIDDRRRVAVARNSEVVPRGEWETTLLAEGDSVEMLAPVAGG